MRNLFCGALALAFAFALSSMVSADSIALWDGVTTKNPGDTVTAIDDCSHRRNTDALNPAATTLTPKTNTTVTRWNRAIDPEEIA